jgi:hypothetical protein
MLACSPVRVLDFQTIAGGRRAACGNHVRDPVSTLLLFIGATGKSRRSPLHLLPDVKAYTRVGLIMLRRW